MNADYLFADDSYFTEPEATKTAKHREPRRQRGRKRAPTYVAATRFANWCKKTGVLVPVSA